VRCPENPAAEEEDNDLSESTDGDYSADSADSSEDSSSADDKSEAVGSGSDSDSTAGDADGAHGERRSSRGAALPPGSYADQGVIAFASRKRRRRSPQSTRHALRQKNAAAYAKRTAERKMCWMDVAKRGIDKLDAALDRWDAGDAHGVWAVSIITDTAPIIKSELKARTLHKRAQLVARFLKLQVGNGNTRRLENQEKVGAELGVSPPLVASCSRGALTRFGGGFSKLGET